MVALKNLPLEVECLLLQSIIIISLIIIFHNVKQNLYRTIRSSIEVCAAAMFPELIVSFCITDTDTASVGTSFWDDGSSFKLLFVCGG